MRCVGARLVVNTRVLPSEEWPRLQGVLEAEGGRLPDPATAQIVVHEAQGEIIGFLVVQLVPHLEPIWVHPDYRGKGLVSSLVNAGRSLLGSGEFFAFSPNRAMGALATKEGLTPLPWTVYRGVN